MKRAVVVLFGLCSLAWSSDTGTAPADEPNAPDPPFGGRRILFIGDSITQAGGYVTDLDAYLLTRYPGREFTVINHGISSETAAGTSEADHAPPRPCVQDRFDRDVVAWAPDVLVICYGMNDGIYQPPALAPRAAYRQGIRRLLDRARAAGIERVVLLTPPPFDPYRRQVGDPEATRYGYRFPAVDYDRTLGDFAAWLRTLDAPPGRRVIDLHTALNEHLAARRREAVSVALAGDAVHPNATGHALMAATILRGLGEGGPRSGAVPLQYVFPAGNTDTSKPVAAEFREAIRLPWPLAADVDPRSIQLAGIPQTLDRVRLRFLGLPDGRYRVSLRTEGREPVALPHVHDARELTAGVGVSQEIASLLRDDARRFREALEARNRARYDAWRKAILTPDPADDFAPPAEDEAQSKQLRELARPREVVIQVEPEE